MDIDKYSEMLTDFLRRYGLIHRLFDHTAFRYDDGKAEVRILVADMAKQVRYKLEITPILDEAPSTVLKTVQVGVEPEDLFEILLTDLRYWEYNSNLIKTVNNILSSLNNEWIASVKGEKDSEKLTYKSIW